MKLPKIETVVLFVFLACVGLWAVSKCSSSRADLNHRSRNTSADEDERPAKRDSVAPAPVQNNATASMTTPAPPVSQPTPATNAPAPAITTKNPPKLPATPATVTQPAAAPATASSYSKLYVTIDGLKMRKQPSLKGELVEKLELYEAVYFLNQKTEKTEEISLGLEKVTHHWVKVRSQSGKEGWVFGAGVHYYKMKRKGVLD